MAVRRSTTVAVWMMVLLIGTTWEQARAQSTPVDLADLSLAELGDVQVVPESHVQGELLWSRDGRWHLGYRYVRVRFEGYRDGTDDIDTDDLLGPPRGGTFPVLPTEIVQEAHLFRLSYDVLKRTTLTAIVPYIRQRTDHISVVPGYDKFTITSDGIGDVSFSISQRLLDRAPHALLATVGVSFPTGSIDEEGDTPRDTGQAEEQLPYTMQLGSGTYDLMLGATYGGGMHAPEAVAWLGSVSLGAEWLAKIRFGRNSRGYRLGNLYLISAWLGVRPFDWIEPTFRVRAQIWERIRGADDALALSPGVFPAPVTDPDNFGGEKVTLLGGVRLGWPRGLFGGRLDALMAGQSIEFEGGSSVYESLNGPQPKEKLRLTVAWNLGF